MENYFDNEIKNMKRELTQLKTATQTSAVAVPTVSQSLSIPITLELANPYLAKGSAYVRVSASSDTILMATLDSYFDDITRATDFPATTRKTYIIMDYKGNGETLIYIDFTGNASDRSTLSGGGSVTVTKQLTVRATEEFTLERI